MIHVCFGLYDKTGRYSKFTGTTMLSMFENTSSAVTVHILHDNTLTQDNREKFIYLAGRYEQAVKFYNVDELCPDKIAEILELAPEITNSQVSIGTFYCTLIPKLLSLNIDKAIYLDSDIIVNLDIKELWQMELEDKPLAAVPEILSYKTIDMMKNAFKLCEDSIVKAEDYFNAGVFLMNLSRLRNEETAIVNALRFRAQNPKYKDCSDQNVWNICFSTEALKLPVKFNRFTQFVRLEKEPLGKKIYHYAGDVFMCGLGFELYDPLNRLWMDYFIKSPWFDTAALERLYERTRLLHIDLKKAMINISAAMSGKTRAFLLFERDLNMLVETFSVRNDEEVILVADKTPVSKIVDTMNLSRNEKIFFIMIPQFPFHLLAKAGLIAGKDFFNAYDFLNETQGHPLWTYPFIAAL